MMIHINKGILLFLILFAITARGAAENRETPDPAPPQPEHPKRIYVSPDGKRYIARELPLYIHISSTPGGDDAVLLEEKNNPVPTPLSVLSEGLNIIKRTGPGPDKQTPPAPDSETGYEVYADGTPPVTVAVFSDAPVYEKEGNRYYGKGLAMDLVSRDLLSGVREVYLSVNGKPYAPQSLNEKGNLKKSFCGGPGGGFLEKSPLVLLRYYAVDQVGNAGEPVEERFYLDVESPGSELTLKGEHAEGILSPGSVLELSSTDTLSGVKDMRYRWDEEAENLYHGEFIPPDLSEGNHTLRYYAVDNTGNVEETRTYTFFYDKSAPGTAASIVGDKGEREGMVFVSPEARIGLDAPDNHAGTAAIRYTIDGGEEQTYTEPFPLPSPAGVHKITYRAVDKVGNWSESRYWSVYLDMTPPDTQYQISGYYASSQQELALRKDARVFLVTTDLEAGVKETRYRVDDGEESVYTDSLGFLTDGEHTLAYWGIDGAHNREKEKILKLRVDNSLKGKSGRDSSGRYTRQWYMDEKGEMTGTVGIPFYLVLSTSETGDGQQFILDIPKLGAETGQAVTFAKGGTVYLSVQAGGPKDRADIFQVRIDALSPVTRAVLSGASEYRAKDGVYFGPGLNVAFTAQDAQKGIVSGCRETYVSLDDSPFFTYTGPLHVFSREKAYRVRYYSVDHVGNSEEVKEMTFTVDTTPPVTTWEVSGMTQGRILSPQSRIELSAVDNLTGVKEIFYRYDTGEEKAYRRVLEASELGRLSEGEHTLFYYAVDQTGNKERTGELAFYFDKAEHTVELRVSGDRYDTGEVVMVSPRSRVGFAATGEQTPIKTILYRVDGGAETPYEKTPVPLPPGSGRHTVSYSGSDAVGNTTPRQTRVIFIDAEPPQMRVKFEGPLFRDRFNTYINSQTVIDMSAVDDHAGVKAIYYRLDGTPVKEYLKPFTLQSGGKHTLAYYAADMVNNGESPQVMTVLVDNEPPQLEINFNAEPRKDGSGGVPVYPRDLDIGFKAVDALNEVDKIIYRIDDGKEHLYRSLISDFSPGKVYKLEVYAVDRLGNKREQTVVFRVE